MSAMKNRDVADQNIFAKLERDGLVAEAVGLGIGAARTAGARRTAGRKIGAASAGKSSATTQAGWWKISAHVAPRRTTTAGSVQSASLVFVSVAARKRAAIDHAVAADENVGEIFAPDQAVMKIGVAAVLISGAGKRLGLVVGVHRLRRAEDHRTGVNEQMDVALQTNGAAQISSRRN